MPLLNPRPLCPSWLTGFSNLGADWSVKNEGRILDWHADIMIPLFTCGLECDYALYNFCSVVLHAGAGVDSGHYTCVTRARGADGEVFLFHDDNVAPIQLPMHRLGSVDLQRQVYVILYVKSN